MPSWPVHLKIAGKISNDNNFILGNVLPDVPNGYIIKNTTYCSSDITHFNYKNKGGERIDINEFLKTYKDKLDNPIILGMLCHLLTDRYFNSYFHKCHVGYKDGKKTAILKDGFIYTDSPWNIKQDDFRIYGNYLVKDINSVSKSNKTMDFVNDLHFNLTSNDIDKTINYINKLVNKKITNEEMKMFSKEELDKLVVDCTNYIKGYLKELNL